MHRLTNEEIELLPSDSFSGRIVLVDSPDSVNAAVAELRQEKLLGFDTETRPSFTRGVIYGVALLQLSSETTTWLIRINRIGLPPEVAQILADDSILKVGAAIRDDIRGLQKKYPFKPANFVDLQTLARENGLEDFSLKKLAAHVLGVKISKRQRLTNWEAPQLSPSQQTYAATDSWISLLTYKGMMNGTFEHERVQQIINHENSQTNTNGQNNS